METRKHCLQFEKSGHLKAGVHNCSWAEFQRLTFTNDHRKHLGKKLLKFLKWPLSSEDFSRLYIGGGFVSDREFPRDIDLVLETQYPFGPQAFTAIEPFFSKGLDNILRVYCVHLHFWMERAPHSVIDYRSFFQYQRPQKHNSLEVERRGIVQLSLRLDDLLDDLPSEFNNEWEKSRSVAANPEVPLSMAA